MTLGEWTEAQRAALKAAGFDSTVHEGFPLVAMPASQEDRVRLLKLPLPWACEKSIYSEGLLVLPPRAR